MGAKAGTEEEGIMQQGMEAHEESKTSSNRKFNPTRIREIALIYSYSASPKGPKMFAVNPSKLFLSGSVGFKFIPGKPPFQEKLLGQISTNSGKILSQKHSTPYICLLPKLSSLPPSVSSFPYLCCGGER